MLRLHAPYPRPGLGDQLGATGRLRSGNLSSLILAAPIKGWAAPLDEVPDPVFSGRLLGDGVAIDPTGGALHAPCDGVIIALAKHAVTLRAANGAEILLHVGIDTVALDGQGFTAHAAQGQSIKAGALLLDFDLEFLALKVKSLISPIVITNSERFRIVRRAENRSVAVGDVLLELEAVAGGAAKVAGGSEASRDVVVPLAHGFHARPAARLAQAAKEFSVDIVMALREKQANAKSVAALMALGVRMGDTVCLTAHGTDAAAAVTALAALIASGLGEGPAAPNAPERPAAVSADPNVIRGVRAAPGLALGKAVQYRAADIAVAEQGQGVAQERAAFARASSALRARMQSAPAAGAQRDILAAHAALLDDPELIAATQALIAQGKSAGFAWRQALSRYADALRGLDDAHLRERADDFKDLERQLLQELTGTRAAMTLPPGTILLADELLPSELAALDASRLAGFVTARGGPTSHVAIIAAGMNLPALAGAGAALASIKDGTALLLDADGGWLRIEPDEDTARNAAATIAARQRGHDAALAQAGGEARTADGTRIEIFANLGGGAAEAADAVRLGAEGCGLLRTEFLFQDRQTPPDEDEQYRVYQAIADTLDGRPLVLRTFDIGGDKPVAYMPLAVEDNPALGLRGVRAGLARPDLLRTQIAAALRVTPPCRLLLPMVSSLDEVRAVRAIVHDLAGTRAVTLGVMIETPSSALIADQLAREADFLSIGTNDLTQYVLAMDRSHPLLGSRIDSLHPAVLRLIAQAADAARAAGKPVAVCGGLAADVAAAPLLLGLGVDELSVPPPVIPAVKARVRALDLSACRAAAREALALESAAAVREFLRTRFPNAD